MAITKLDSALPTGDGKKSNTGLILFGLAVLITAGWAYYEFVHKPRKQKEEEANANKPNPEQTAK